MELIFDTVQLESISLEERDVGICRKFKKNAECIETVDVFRRDDIGFSEVVSQ